MLLIGLGTSGAKVCNQVLERLEWNYGSAGRLPWLRTLVLETAPVSADQPLANVPGFLHLSVDKQGYGALLGRPMDHSETLDLPRWLIRSVATGVDAVTDGAKNVRHLGRLAFLYRTNFTQVRDAIGQRWQALQSLTDEDARQEFNAGQSDPVAIQLSTRGTVASAPAVYVYVVGSLCGGTSSGMFLDLGYLLRRFDQEGSPLTSAGVFMLPANNETNPRHVANTYSGLIELNHYSSDRVQYSAQFPDRPGRAYSPVTAGVRPFDHTYLVQSPAGDKEAEYARLITACADYVYSDLLGSSGNDRDADRTNIKEYFVAPDTYGAPQKLFSFGLSVVEFPYSKVAEACMLRLALPGYKGIAGGQPLSALALKGAVADIALMNPDALRKQLLQASSGSIDGQLRAVIQEVAGKSHHTEDALTILEAQVLQAFDGDQPATHIKLPARLVPLTIDNNEKAVADTLLQACAGAVRSLLGPDSRAGLEGVLSLLQEFASHVEGRCKDLDMASSTSVHELQTAAASCRARAAECMRDKPVGLVGIRRMAVRRYVEDYLAIMQQLADARLRAATAPAMRRVYTECLAWIQRVQSRISDGFVGFREEVRGIANGIQTEEVRINVVTGKTTDGWSRTINGWELFDDRTVESEHNRCLQASGIHAESTDIEARLGARIVAPYLEEALATLLADRFSQGRFDTGVRTALPKLSRGDVLARCGAARAYIDPIGRRGVLERMAERPDLAEKLSDAVGRSRALLDVNEASPRYQEAENKHYGYVFFDTACHSAEAFRRALAPIQSATGLKEATWKDRFTVLFLREQGAFSLGMIPVLDDALPSHWRAKWEQEKPDRLRSRGDIEPDGWITWAKVDEEWRVKCRDAVLVGIALGVVEFKSMTQYRFQHKDGVVWIGDQHVLLSNDLDEAVKAMRRERALPVLEERIAAFRTASGDMEAIERFGRLVKGQRTPDDVRPEAGCTGWFVEADMPLEAAAVRDHLVGYILRDTGLSEAFGRTPEGQSSSLARYRGDPTQRQDAEWFYCPHCKQKLGQAPDALYVIEDDGGKRKRVARCAVCRKGFDLG
jgi:hypothetical protein